MKFSATFAVLAILSVKTIVSAFSVASTADLDLEMREEFTDGEVYEVVARELLDYSNEFEGVGARELDDEDFLYVRVPMYSMRLKPTTMARNTGETRLQNTIQKSIDQNSRSRPQVRIARPTFKQVAQKVIQQNRANRGPNAAQIGRQTTTNINNLRQKINNINAAKRK
ncbi:hypothetical protein EST38_g8153 [Candolleomyces aberdarensis]|uniref:Uncharacterized protein n=1 Tax=Candolleomyces aberdarensis TaxID=2316362 RepID=A0A4Q2DDW6_9AGAR|nr:hypothetical protein EST38_g8153 [Candolleomyces aberdarensis]